jgi:DNA invertase Pin-like site-specific DNA recombinase
VREHLDGGNWTLVGEFVEIESGKRADRPKLAEAIKACRLRGAKLVIAKLDRLARNVAFISNLMESGVEFEAVDFPQANRLTIHIMAAMAEHEAKMISDRTKAALAAAKRRGVKLGGDRGARLTAQARAAGRAALQAKAQERAADLAATVRELQVELQAAGCESLRTAGCCANSTQKKKPRPRSGLNRVWCLAALLFLAASAHCRAAACADLA